MSDNVINYFVSGNTAKGFHSLLETNIADVEVIFLRGSYSKVKSELLTLVSNKWQKESNTVEVLHSSFNTNYIEGVINRDKKIALIATEKFDESKADTVIDINSIFDKNILKVNVEDILEIEDKITECYELAYRHFENALNIHDEWEEIYISNMNKERANSYSNEVINMLIRGNKKNKVSVVRHRFFGAATHEGAKDYVLDLIEPINKRYFIKGRPGTGKSTMLKSLVDKASENGLDVEVYHCGFDPNSLDMVLLRELDVVIFDSTAPHEYFPSRNDDEVIDMYRRIIAHKTDEKYEQELKEIVSRYKIEVSEATNLLKKAKAYNDEIEEVYAIALIDQKLDLVKENLLSII